MRHFGLGIARVEGQLVAALAVGGERDRLRIGGVARGHELVAHPAVEHLAPSLRVEHAFRIEMQFVIEAQRVRVARVGEVGMAVAEGGNGGDGIAHVHARFHVRLQIGVAADAFRIVHQRQPRRVTMLGMARHA